MGVLSMETFLSNNGIKRSTNSFQLLWTRIVMQDAGIFMATMNLAAAHLDAVRGDNKIRGSPEFFQQKGDTFNKINAKLKDPNEAISNKLIGAIAMLTMAAVTADYTICQLRRKLIPLTSFYLVTLQNSRSTCRQSTAWSRCVAESQPLVGKLCCKS